MFEESLGRKITWSSWRHRFPQAPLSKCFPSTLKLKPDFFKFLHPFEERFQRAAFSWRISADGRPNHRNKSWVLKFLRRKTHIFLRRRPNSKEKVISNKVIANLRFWCIRTLFYQLTQRIYIKGRLGTKTPMVNTKWPRHFSESFLGSSGLRLLFIHVCVARVVQRSASTNHLGGLYYMIKQASRKIMATIQRTSKYVTATLGYVNRALVRNRQYFSRSEVF